MNIIEFLNDKIIHADGYNFKIITRDRDNIHIFNKTTALSKTCTLSTFISDLQENELLNVLYQDCESKFPVAFI